jgi:hypothetical protein
MPVDIVVYYTFTARIANPSAAGLTKVLRKPRALCIKVTERRTLSCLDSTLITSRTDLAWCHHRLAMHIPRRHLLPEFSDCSLLYERWGGGPRRVMSTDLDPEP